MSKPTGRNVRLIIEHDDFSVRLARVQIWVHEHGNGGRGIILDLDQSVEFVEGYNDLLDEIEGVSPA
jgi:hypothetical protein